MPQRSSRADMPSRVQTYRYSASPSSSSDSSSASGAIRFRDPVGPGAGQFSGLPVRRTLHPDEQRRVTTLAPTDTPVDRQWIQDSDSDPENPTYTAAHSSGPQRLFEGYSNASCDQFAHNNSQNYRMHPLHPQTGIPSNRSVDSPVYLPLNTSLSQRDFLTRQVPQHARTVTFRDDQGSFHVARIGRNPSGQVAFLFTDANQHHVRGAGGGTFNAFNPQMNVVSQRGVMRPEVSMGKQAFADYCAHNYGQGSFFYAS
jgi:hypothetical protein